MLKQNLIFLFMLKVLLCKSDFFSFNLLFKLIDLVINYFVSSLSLCNLILSFTQCLAVCITIRSNRLIKLLLFFQLIFSLYILLLILGDKISLELDLFKRLLIFCISKCCLFSIHIFLFLDLKCCMLKTSDCFISLSYFIFVTLDLFLLLGKLFIIAFKLTLHISKISQDYSSFSLKFLYLLTFFNI